MSTSLKKRCLYELYAPCDHTKCKREHRHNVFDEKQTSLRSHIKEKRICVAFMLFGKCSHENYKTNRTKSSYYKHTHLSLRELKQKLFGARGRPEVKLREVVTKTDVQTISNSHQINLLNLQISELESKIQEQKTLISSFQDRIDNLNIVKEPPVKTDVQVQTDLVIEKTNVQVQTNPVIEEPDEVYEFIKKSKKNFEIAETLFRTNCEQLIDQFLNSKQHKNMSDDKKIFRCILELWSKYLTDLNHQFITTGINKKNTKKDNKKGELRQEAREHLENKIGLEQHQENQRRLIGL